MLGLGSPSPAPEQTWAWRERTRAAGLGTPGGFFPTFRFGQGVEEWIWHQQDGGAEPADLCAGALGRLDTSPAAPGLFGSALVPPNPLAFHGTQLVAHPALSEAHPMWPNAHPAHPSLPSMAQGSSNTLWCSLRPIWYGLAWADAHPIGPEVHPV